MQILGNGDQPSFKFVSLVKRIYFVECLGKGLYGNILCVVLVIGSNQLKSVDVVPIVVQ